MYEVLQIFKNLRSNELKRKILQVFNKKKTKKKTKNDSGKT